MAAITATEARKSLFGIIQQVDDDRTAIEVVSRQGNVVILSKDAYDALAETAYLLRNPANAERLLIKHILAGAWSRRIDDAHRLVYFVTDDHIVILQARDHC